MKKKKGCLITSIVIFGLFAFGLIFGISQIMKDPEAYNSSSEAPKIDMILDASQYSRITFEELTDLLGEPSNTENWNYNGNDVVTYTYKNDSTYEFMMIDDQIVRFTILYDEPQELKTAAYVFPMYGITPSDNLKQIKTGSSVLKYHMVSDKIAEVFVPEVKDDSFDMIKFTYNLNYFD